MSRGKGKSKPTTSRRAEKQAAKDRFAHAKEDAQLAGVLPTVPSAPEESLKPDRVSLCVDPLQGLPETVRQALKENWATPATAKPAVIAALLRPFFNKVEMIDADGNLVSVAASPKLLNELARTIMLLDQRQYERDNPEAAGKAKGGINISKQTNITAVQLIKGMQERGELSHLGRLGAESSSTESSTSGDSGFNGQVDSSSTPNEDQRGVDGGVANTE